MSISDLKIDLFAESELGRIETRIERLGPINLVALSEYQQELERKSELDHQHAELREALETLEDAIRKIDRETRSLFRNTFDAINDRSVKSSHNYLVAERLG